MGWKDWPYWLKGGVIFEILLIIGLFLIAFIKGEGLAILFLLIFFGGENPWEMFTFLGFLILYFILGAIIGWIYGKIRNRNSQ
ncbi:hypothetical protein J4225_03285 [Candidatus Pacearchaeota archaeon]|nr:hypothetical protein [Candidatus Pacearchaeota archaeon]